MVEVDGRRRRAVMQRQDGEDRLQRTGAAEQVPGRALGGRDGDRLEVIAEHAAHRVVLGDVADRRAGGVGVDVDDVGELGVGLLHRRDHRASGGRSLGVGGGDVVRVARDRSTCQFGVDARPASQSVLLGLQHDGARAFAQDEAVAVDIVGAGCPHRIVVALGQRLHGGEGGDGQRVDGGLGSAGDDHVGESRLKVVVGVDDGLGARGARGDHGPGSAPCGEVHADRGRGAVRHEHRHRHR